MATGAGPDEGQGTKNCPSCGEAVKDTWNLCPACEAPLGRLACPGCGLEVKQNWKLCPECEQRLKCAGCGRRLPPGGAECPACRKPGAVETETRSAFTEPLTGMEFVLVPAGTFQMGDLHGEGWDNETPLREVRIESFYLGRYPATQSQWEKVMGENPAMFRKGGRYPVEQVSWRDANEFILRLNGLTVGVGPFRLPTEAEWEYAARGGGKKELYAGGDDIDSLAWYADNSGGSTQPVGLKAPNGLGLFDMSGNVWEWCQDLYTAGSGAARRRERPLQARAVCDRVIRGGSWNLDAWSARCSRRFGFAEDYFGAGLGFRLAKSVLD